MKELPSFEEMVKMAKEDPQALEALRTEMCEAVINSAPERHHRKLRGLQFKIDMERRRAKTPMASCIRLSQMMHESFSQLRSALNDMQSLPLQNIKDIISEPMQKVQAKSGHDAEPAADVIEFPVN